VRNVQKRFFTATFVLVIAEEVLRQISYVKYSPFFEPNVYVAMMSQWITPYVASSIVFLTVCAVLFVVNKYASKMQNKGNNSQINSQIKLLKKVMPLGIYAIIIAVYIPTTIQWLSILLT
jgi:fucose permease